MGSHAWCSCRRTGWGVWGWGRCLLGWWWRPPVGCPQAGGRLVRHRGGLWVWQLAGPRDARPAVFFFCDHAAFMAASATVFVPDSMPLTFAEVRRSARHPLPLGAPLSCPPRPCAGGRAATETLGGVRCASPAHALAASTCGADTWRVETCVEGLAPALFGANGHVVGRRPVGGEGSVQPAPAREQGVDDRRPCRCTASCRRPTGCAMVGVGVGTTEARQC